MPGQPARLLLVGGEGEEVRQQMSLCSLIPRPKPAAPTPGRSPRRSTTLNRKSSTPPPPYSSGTAIPRKPLRAGGREHLARHDARRAPTASWCGTTSFSRKRRKLSRNASCSSSNRWRRMGDPSRRRWRAVAYQRAGARSPASLDSPPCGARSSRAPVPTCAQCRTPLSPRRPPAATAPAPRRRRRAAGRPGARRQGTDGRRARRRARRAPATSASDPPPRSPRRAPRDRAPQPNESRSSTTSTVFVLSAASPSNRPVVSLETITEVAPLCRSRLAVLGLHGPWPRRSRAGRSGAPSA